MTVVVMTSFAAAADDGVERPADGADQRLPRQHDRRQAAAGRLGDEERRARARRGARDGTVAGASEHRTPHASSSLFQRFTYLYTTTIVYITIL